MAEPSEKDVATVRVIFNVIAVGAFVWVQNKYGWDTGLFGRHLECF
jgi:hypothetical protein